MNIVVLGNDVLRRTAEPIKNIGTATAKLSVDMLETLLEAKGLGLAAPQVGVSERLFVVHIADDMPRIFINPEILESSPEAIKYEEGCLSLPGIYADVNRPGAVRVRAWNEKGKPFTLDAEGLLARVIQHEMDHLNGVMFIDLLSELKRKRILKVWEEKFRA
jgi:peptide deformylase